MRFNSAIPVAVFALTAALFPLPARAWDPLRSANGNVEQGNKKMKEKDHAAALESYDKAARELPSSGGVQLNRGLALMAEGKLPEAREALLRATEPPASDQVRADAYYNLGVAFYREADQKAKDDDHEQAAKLFREAEDSLRRSLRMRPGNGNAAWNLELAMRREQEQQQKQQQKEQQQQKQQEQQDQQEDQQQQDGQQDQQQDEQQQQQQPDQKSDEEDKDGQKEGQDQRQQKPEPKPEQQKPQQKPEQQPQKQRSEPTPQQRALPRDVARALDALQDSEENLERHRARIRAARERRRPEKDW